MNLFSTDPPIPNVFKIITWTREGAEKCNFLVDRLNLLPGQEGQREVVPARPSTLLVRHRDTRPETSLTGGCFYLLQDH